jgi:predicted Zn-dependent protease
MLFFMTRSLFSALAVSLIAVAAASCATTMTGRRQLNMVSDEKMNAMGVAAFADLKQKGRVEADPGTNAYVRCVADAIVDVIPAQYAPAKTDWEVVVFEDPTPNAFALPGAKIGVHTGMLEIAQTPDQLAAVVGHEVGHVLLEHGNERVSQALMADGAVQIGSIAAGAAGAGYSDLIVGGLGIGAQYGVILPFSRKHESEADRVGQRFMAQAGFDPRASIELWQNMKAQSKGEPPQWLSTHPAHDSRISDLERQLPEALALYGQAKPHRCTKRARSS